MKLTAKACLCLACVAALLLCTACATVMRGSSEAFGIISIPDGARVRASTGWTCVTPCEVEISRRSAFALDIEKPGYRAARVVVRAAHDEAGRRGLIGNIVFGGLIGAAIDSGSGAAFSHPVNPLVIELVPD